MDESTRVKLEREKNMTDEQKEESKKIGTEVLKRLHTEEYFLGWNCEDVLREIESRTKDEAVRMFTAYALGGFIQLQKDKDNITQEKSFE